MIRIQQIFVKSEDVALQVQQKLDSNEKFESLASTYNEAGVIEKNLARGEYDKVVDDVVFRLDNNEVSGMITTEEGYYFIKCINKFDEELTEENKKNIVIKRRKEQFDDKYMEFMEASLFELNEKAWENIKVDTSAKIKTKSFFDTYDKYFTE